jgi:hypothetical protein
VRLAHAAFILVAGSGVFAGCVHPVHLNEDYGNSYGLMMESQLLHPEAEPSREPVEGLAGPAAKRAVQVYQRSFDKSESAQSGAAGGSAPAAGASPLAGAPPSYSSAATGTSPPAPDMK